MALFGSPYEEPKNPDLVLEADKEMPKQSVEKLFEKLKEKKWLF